MSGKLTFSNIPGWVQPPNEDGVVPSAPAASGSPYPVPATPLPIPLAEFVTVPSATALLQVPVIVTLGPPPTYQWAGALLSQNGPVVVEGSPSAGATIIGLNGGVTAEWGFPRQFFYGDYTNIAMANNPAPLASGGVTSVADTAGWWSPTTNGGAYVPQQAGWYRCVVTAGATSRVSTLPVDLYVGVCENNAQAVRGAYSYLPQVGSDVAWGASCATMVHCNGTTDYIQAGFGWNGGINEQYCTGQFSVEGPITPPGF